MSMLSRFATLGGAPPDPYWNYVTLLLTGDGSSGSTSIVDSSKLNNTITNTGVTINTSTKKYGSGSLYFNGSSFLTTANSAITNVGSGDFTVDFWVNFNSVSATQNIFEGYTDNSLSMRFGINFQAGSANGLCISKSNVSDNDYCNYSFSTGGWYFISIVRQSGVIKFFVNGFLQTDQNPVIAGYSFPSTVNMNIGRNHNAPRPEYFNNYIDDFRITVGIARYTTNFTPPTAPFPTYGP